MAEKSVILHAVESFGGGVLQSIANICGSLSDEFDFVVLHRKRPDTPADCKDHFPPGTRFIRWRVGKSISPWLAMSSIVELRRVAASTGASRVHAHSSVAGALARLAFPARRAYVVYSPHCYVFLRQDIPRGLRLAYDAVERVLGFCTSHPVVACGYDEWLHVRGHARRAYCVANTVDCAVIDRVVKGVDKASTPTVVSCGRICPQKNFPLFASLAGTFAGRNTRFLWIGDGEVPPGIEMPPNMRITGWLSHDEALRRMAEGHVYLQTALWEGLALTCLEAGALGIPMLLSPVDGARELAGDKEAGFVCNSSEEFVQGLEFLLSHETDRDRIGGQARRLVENRYSPKAARALWSELYRTGALVTLGQDDG